MTASTTARITAGGSSFLLTGSGWSCKSTKRHMTMTGSVSPPPVPAVGYYCRTDTAQASPIGNCSGMFGPLHMGWPQ